MLTECTINLLRSSSSPGFQLPMSLGGGGGLIGSFVLQRRGGGGWSSDESVLISDFEISTVCSLIDQIVELVAALVVSIQTNLVAIMHLDFSMMQNELFSMGW